MSDFQIKVREKDKGKSCLVVPSGRLDSLSALDMEDELTKLMRRKSIDLKIDMKDLSFISEEGMGLLLGIQSSLRSEGRSVVFMNVPGKIDAKIKMIGAGSYFVCA
ncbi:MAG TPA: STAS domain-containing protein [Candidatus Krumholzibacteriaceae bacterium]|nr:STAS domain-containing protein [Candidatus Krumholzibacteriaceae bacterium]